jgi:Eco57I restriction-modification methylase/restriction endonuclease TaqI-like protein
MTTLDCNHYQHQTSPSKLRGQYYTPDELVALMLDGIHLAPPHIVIDPACGDGSFLKGVVAAIARKFRGADRQALARYWSGRLLGFDVDAAAIAEARSGLRDAFLHYLGVDVSEGSLPVHQADIFQYPRLARLLKAVGLPKLHADERLIVIGNPPYVEAKRLSREAKEALRTRYPEAVAGAPDLYLYFLHVCIGWLRAADTLAFVLPNKLLVNANAQRIRERLLEEGRLRSLWFATQAAIFPDAAVYPIVLFAGGPKGKSHQTAEITQITRTAAQNVAQGERLTVDTIWYRRTAARAFFPLPATPTLRHALETLLRHPEDARLVSVLDIRWTVSFHRAGLREQYVLPRQPDDPCARPFIGGGPFSGNGEVTRYQLQWAGWWIRYDAAELQSRKNPLPDLSLFDRSKIAICQNGRTLRAAYDDQGFVLKDTFLCGAIREADHPLCRHPRAIVGLLCSRAVHFFYAHVFYGGHVNGGYLHFLGSFLVDIPVGTWTDAAAAAAAALVRRCETLSGEEREGLEEEIETLVSAALGLTDLERTAIAEWAANDPNWQARARVRGPKAAGD